MCLTFFTVFPSDSKHGYRFVLAFNRDEKTERATIPLGPFQEDSNILAGRDPISGGTWLGINIQVGVVVFLTNYHVQNHQRGRSRGKMVYHLLSTASYTSDKSTTDVIEETLRVVLQVQKQYSPFNLVVYDVHGNKAYYINSRHDMKEPRVLIQGKHYGLCNCDIDTLWRKTHYGLSLYTRLFDQTESPSKEELLSKLKTLMNDKKTFLQDPDLEASIFVHPYFCTREHAKRQTKSSTFILIKHDFSVSVREVSYINGKQSVIDCANII